MRILWAILGLSAVAAAQMPEAGLLAAKPPDTGKSARIAVHAPGALPERYSVYRTGEEQSCLLIRDAGQLPGTASVETDPACAEVFKPLAQAAFWQEGEHGNVVLKDRDGNRIAELAPGDGLAFQSVEPASPILALVALDDQ
jgi:hypothetical protein